MSTWEAEVPLPETGHGAALLYLRHGRAGAASPLDGPVESGEETLVELSTKDPSSKSNGVLTNKLWKWVGPPRIRMDSKGRSAQTHRNREQNGSCQGTGLEEMGNAGQRR